MPIIDPRKRRQEIRESLARNVIIEPLYSEIQKSPGLKEVDVVIDVNLDYYKGRKAVFERVRELAEQARRPREKFKPPWSVGSETNPFMAACLPAATLKKMVALDQATAQEKAQAEQDPSGNQIFKGKPLDLKKYLAIFRVWKNFAVHPLIDRSAATVKADAARRAFLAEGRDIVWAVIDSGIDRNHEHFKDLNSLSVSDPVKPRDFTGEGDPGLDGFGHGTHVAGVIAGGLVNPRPALALRSRLRGRQVEEYSDGITQIAGMAPSCKLVSLKVLDRAGKGNVDRIIEALDYVQQINDYGRRMLIHGVNLSVGYEFDPSWFACGESPVCVEVNRLVRSGVIVVVAAGNTGYGALSSRARQTGAGMMLTINDPGNADLGITVGSTHRDMPHTYGVSYFSSKGPTGDGRLKPDLVAPGERILSCRSSALPAAAGEANTYYEQSGTSMAAPHVSGVIAAFLSIRREYIGQPEKVKQLFLSTATDLSRERYFQGRGLVDLMRAIQAV